MWVSFLWMGLLLPLCMILFFTTGDHELEVPNGTKQIPTVSYSGSPFPISILFAYTLHFECFFSIIAFFCIYTVFDRRIEGYIQTTKKNDDNNVNASNQSDVQTQGQTASPSPFSSNNNESSNTDDTQMPTQDQVDNNTVHVTVPNDIEAPGSVSNAQTGRLVNKSRSRSICTYIAMFNTLEDSLHDLINSDYSHPLIDLTIRVFEICSLGFLYSLPCCCWLCRTSPKPDSLRWWNTFLLRMGIVSSILMSLVGSFTVTYTPIVHGTCAFLMFALFALHVYLSYYHIAIVLYPMKKVRRLIHSFSLFMIIPFNFIMTIVAGILYKACANINQDCEYTTVDIFPALEYSMIIALLIYILHFEPDCSHITLTCESFFQQIDDSKKQKDSDRSNLVIAM